jgi:hypothetical protein
MVLWIFFSAIFFTLSSLGLDHKVVTDTTSPVWRIDLRSVGFTGFAPKQEQWGLHLRPNSLCFVDKNVLTATFITREIGATLAQRNQTGESLPLKLHGIFLDADLGKVLDTKEWSITRPRGGVVAADDGRFVVLAPGRVALHSPSLELVKDFKLSSEQESHLWNFYTSPTGKSILVEYHYPEASFQWIDVGSLQPQLTWKDSLPGVSISDDELAFPRDTYVKSKGTVHQVFIRQRNGSEQAVCRAIVGKGDPCGVPEFISNEALALLTPHGLTIVPKTGGDSLLKVTFRDDEWLVRPLYPSADGKRFAVEVWTHRGGSALLDIGSNDLLQRIVVYDLPSRRAICILEARELKIRKVSGVALSRDGSQLAILEDGIVEVYRVTSTM